MKLSLLSAVLLASGCAVGTGNGVEDAGPPLTADSGHDAGGKKTPPEAGSPQNDSGTVQGSDAAVMPTDMTCAAEATLGSCEQCCLTVHPTGYMTYHQALQACACSSPGACATECATEMCANQPTTTGDACETCITSSLMQGTGACYMPVDTACQADSDCTTLFQTCIPPCESK